MIDAWTAVRFLHVLGAIVWVGGELTVTVVVMPPVYRLLALADRTEVLRAVGYRFAMLTLAVFLPVQITTGVLLAMEHGVTWSALLQPGYGRVLFAKLSLFAMVMALAGVHGLAQHRKQLRFARIASLTSLIGSLGIVLLATVLVEGHFH